MEAQKDMLSPDTLAAIRWLGMPEGTPFPLAVRANTSPRPLAQPEPPPDDPAAWEAAFASWVKSACVRHDRSFGGIGCLYVHFAEWAITHDAVPCTRQTFEVLLTKGGFLLCDGMVSGLILHEDFEAAL